MAEVSQSLFKFLRFLFRVLRVLFDALKSINFFHKDVNTHDSPREQYRACNKSQGCLSPMQHSDRNIKNYFTNVKLIFPLSTNSEMSARRGLSSRGKKRQCHG